jgi:hypothetical protein
MSEAFLQELFIVEPCYTILYEGKNTKSHFNARLGIFSVGMCRAVMNYYKILSL